MAVALLQLLPALGHAVVTLPAGEPVTIQCCDSAVDPQDDETCASSMVTSRCVAGSPCGGCGGLALLDGAPVETRLWPGRVPDRTAPDYRSIPPNPGFKPPESFFAIR